MIIFGRIGVYCLSDNVVAAHDAEIRINAAYKYRLEQCKANPSFPIFIPFDIQEPLVNECEAEILSAACPIAKMPAGCVYLYFKKAPHDDLDR
ncbi:MAG: hypothetical protein HY042_11345 [Spirochaetia bacterium]|nr:hypothetical protein [Spirochaetia bacterium]